MKEEVIEAAVRAGDKDRLSQLAVSEGGLLSDEVSITRPSLVTMIILPIRLESESGPDCSA